MKPILKSIATAGIGGVMGAALVLAVQNISNTQRNFFSHSAPTEGFKETNPSSKIFDFEDALLDHSFGPANTFSQLEKMHRQIEKQFDIYRLPTNTDGEEFSLHADIAQREDDRFVYLDVSVPNIKDSSITTKVQDGYVTISGTIEKNSADSTADKDEAMARTIFRSSFNRTFPLPPNVDESKMELNSEKDKLILKFPKLVS